MRIELDIRDFNGVLNTLHSLPEEVVSKRGGPVRAALRKGARVILAAEKYRLQAVMGHQKDGEHRQATGLLLNSLIATRGKSPIGSNGETYLVRVKKQFYPGRGQVSTRKTAHLLEYGSSKQPAEPWKRPAFQSKADEALSTIQKEMYRQIERIVKKLAAANKGK